MIKLGKVMLPAIAAMVFIGMPATSTTAKSGSFSKFYGTWSGTGTARLEGGKREKLRCRGYYKSRQGGNGLGMAIRCASAGNKIELRAGLTKAGSRVVGSWEERTFNAGGSVSGSSSGNAMRLTVSGSISGTLSLSVKGNRQRVSLGVAGGGLNGVTISMRRR